MRFLLNFKIQYFFFLFYIVFKLINLHLVHLNFSYLICFQQFFYFLIHKLNIVLKLGIQNF